jgi:hypothetical protein
MRSRGRVALRPLFFKLLGEFTVASRFLDDVWGGFELIDIRALRGATVCDFKQTLMFQNDLAAGGKFSTAGVGRPAL